jgi:hypothetical protein
MRTGTLSVQGCRLGERSDPGPIGATAGRDKTVSRCLTGEIVGLRARVFGGFSRMSHDVETSSMRWLGDGVRQIPQPADRSKRGKLENDV